MSADQADRTETGRDAFEAWCPYKGAPDPYVVWTAAWQTATAHERARILALLPVAGYVDAAALRKAIGGE